MAEESLFELLRYDALEDRKGQWVREYGVDVQADWLPFHFAYTDLFYGLHFSAINLGWRRLDTIHDLFELCFQFSLVLWLEANNQTEDPRGLALELFKIPRNFATESIPLSYDRRCSDPLTQVVTFRPLALALQYYSEKDCGTLLDWYGFDRPDYQVTEILSASMKGCYVNENYLLLPQAPKRASGEGDLHLFLRYVLQQLNTPFPPFRVTGRAKLLSLDEYATWESEWRPWLLAQLSRLILCHAAITYYTGSGFGVSNLYCRGQGQFDYQRERSYNKEIPDIVRKLLQLYTLVPPLPAPLVVSRGVGGVKFQTLPLGEVQVEEGFMSVSLVGASSFMNETVLYLTIPREARVLALLVRLNFQQELLLPPGTRYILHRRWEETGKARYEGEVLL